MSQLLGYFYIIPIAMSLVALLRYVRSRGQMRVPFRDAEKECDKAREKKAGAR